jgi:hypothetical protein
MELRTRLSRGALVAMRRELRACVIIQSDIQISMILIAMSDDFGRAETFELFPRNCLNLKLQITEANRLRETLRTLGKKLRILKTLRS